MPTPPPLPKLDRMERKWIGTRVGFALAAVAVWFGTLAAIHYSPELTAADVLTGCISVIGALSIAIVGDTARPSGMRTGAFGVTATGPEDAP